MSRRRVWRCATLGSSAHDYGRSGAIKAHNSGVTAHQHQGNDEMEAPAQIKMIGGVYMLAGGFNLFVQWWLVSTVILFGGSLVGGFCTGVVTLGMCPVGGLCGLWGVVSYLLLPLGVVQLVLGLLHLVAPDTVKGVVRILPFPQLLALLAGDIVSPIAAIVAIFLSRSDEASEWLDS